MLRIYKIIILLLLLLQCGAFAVGLEIGTPAPPFNVVSGDGQKISSDQLKGEAIVIFYENKDAVEKNRKLKNTLNNLFLNQSDKLAALPVVDCSGAFFPFLNIWKQQLVKASQREGLVIYGDWDGKMKKAYQVADKDSNFFLIDKNGIVQYFVFGQVGDKNIAEITEKIKGMLK